MAKWRTGAGCSLALCFCWSKITCWTYLIGVITSEITGAHEAPHLVACGCFQHQHRRQEIRTKTGQPTILVSLRIKGSDTKLRIQTLLTPSQTGQKASVSGLSTFWRGWMLIDVIWGTYFRSIPCWAASWNWFRVHCFGLVWCLRGVSCLVFLIRHIPLAIRARRRGSLEEKEKRKRNLRQYPAIASKATCMEFTKLIQVLPLPTFAAGVLTSGPGWVVSLRTWFLWGSLDLVGQSLASRKIASKIRVKWWSCLSVFNVWNALN